MIDPMLACVSRRAALRRLGAGFGGMALATLLGETASGGDGSSTHGPRPGAPAKAVIQLFMHGGPSHVDLLDPKPLLTKYDGTAPPSEVADDENRTKHLMKGAFGFRKCTANANADNALASPPAAL